MTDSKPLIERLCACIEAIPPRDRDWYVVRDPWRAKDDEPWLISGNPDPHIGMPVCNFDDAVIAGVDDKFSDDEWSDHNWAMAEFIEAADPNTVLSLIKEIQDLREALKPATEVVETLDQHLSDDWVPVQTSVVKDLQSALAKLEGSGV